MPMLAVRRFEVRSRHWYTHIGHMSLEMVHNWPAPEVTQMVADNGGNGGCYQQ